MWFTRAACRQSALDFTDAAAAPPDLEQMRKVCQACPVIRQCERDSAEDPDVVGMRAGVSQRQRNRRRGRLLRVESELAGTRSAGGVGAARACKARDVRDAGISGMAADSEVQRL